jgi:hypothetical protein
MIEEIIEEQYWALGYRLAPFFCFSAPVRARREDRTGPYGLPLIYPLTLPTRLRGTRSRELHSTPHKANSARQRHPRLFLE